MPDDQRARTAREALVLAAVLLAAVVVFDRGQPVPQPEKTVTGALLLALAGLAWALCRCIRLRWWACGAAVLLVAVCPPFLSVMRDGFGSPATVVGVIAALVALLLLVRPRPGRPALVVGAGAVVVAVVLAPPTLWCLSGPVLALWRSARSRASEAQDATVVWVAVGAHALLVFGVVVGWGRFGAASSTGTDDVGAVAALVGGLAVTGGLVLRRVRPLALSSLTTLTAVLVPGRAPESLVLLAVIVTCVVVAAVADGFVRYRPTRLAGRDVRRLVPALAVAAAVTVGALVLPGWAPRVLPAAVPGSGQVAEGRSGPATSPPSPATDTATPSTTPRPTPTPSPSAAEDGGALLAGRQLAANPRVRTTGAARADLVAGRVDVRVLATLATLADTLDLGVDSFRDAAAEGSGPLRSVRIDRLDSATVQRDGPATAAVVRMLGAQQGIFRPAVEYVSDVGDGSALVLTFPDTTT